MSTDPEKKSVGSGRARVIPGKAGSVDSSAIIERLGGEREESCSRGRWGCGERVDGAAALPMGGAGEGRVRTIRLGDILVEHGALTMTQRDQVLAAQRLRGGAFGALAEEMYGLSPAAVERAWAEQYAGYAPTLDPRDYAVNPRAVGAIERRQAWQFRVMPMDFVDGESESGLLCCTTKEHLVRALRFTGWKLGHSVQFVLGDPRHLGEAMMRWFPMAGMTPRMISGGFAAV